MTLSTIAQFGIAVFGVTAVYLTQSPRTDRRRFACIFGLVGQPFWFASAFLAEQWGVLLLCVLYTYAWGRGFYLHFLTKEKSMNEVFGFSAALEHIKAGAKVSRRGWNGEGMFVFLVPGSTFTVNRPPLLGIYPEGTEVSYHAHIDMRTAGGTIVPWLASQTDLLANDWVVEAV